MDFEEISKVLLDGLGPLQNYEFHFYNPIFWIFLFCLLILLLKIWDPKKAIQYCLLLAFVLLCTTEIQSRCIALFSSPGNLFDTAVIKLISITVVMLLSMFYFFLP